MATAEPISEERPRSLFSGLWARWKAKRARDRSRNLGHVRFRLTREGIHFIGILLFIFIGAVIREISLLILLAGAMIGLIMLQWRFNTSTLVGLRVSRRLERFAKIGQGTTVALKLANPKKWLSAWLVQVDDRVQKVQPERKRLSVKGTALVDAIRPENVLDSEYELEFHERGEYRIGPSTLSTRFPLGLGIGWRTIDSSSNIYVHPKEGTLTAAANSLFHLDQLGQAKSSSKSGTEEGEFFGLRPWSTGDSKRWIHWRTTARLGELTVRQFEQQQQRQITILLDLYRQGNSEEEHEAVEKAISFVATLASKTVRQGRDRLAIAIAAETLSTYPAILSPLLVNSVLDDLAIASDSEAPDLLGAVRALSVPIQTNSRLLVVSTRENCLADLRGGDLDSLTERLLATVRTRWLNVSAGELEAYFQWT